MSPERRLAAPLHGFGAASLCEPARREGRSPGCSINLSPRQAHIDEAPDDFGKAPTIFIERFQMRFSSQSQSPSLPERVAAVRAEVFDLIPHVSRMALDHGSADRALMDAVISIQSAANHLGTVQSSVDRPPVPFGPAFAGEITASRLSA